MFNHPCPTIQAYVHTASHKATLLQIRPRPLSLTWEMRKHVNIFLAQNSVLTILNPRSTKPCSLQLNFFPVFSFWGGGVSVPLSLLSSQAIYFIINTSCPAPDYRHPFHVVFHCVSCHTRHTRYMPNANAKSVSIEHSCRCWSVGGGFFIRAPTLPGPRFSFGGVSGTPLCAINANQKKMKHNIAPFSDNSFPRLLTTILADHPRTLAVHSRPTPKGRYSLLDSKWICGSIFLLQLFWPTLFFRTAKKERQKNYDKKKLLCKKNAKWCWFYWLLSFADWFYFYQHCFRHG